MNEFPGLGRVWRVGYVGDPLGFVPIERRAYNNRFDDVQRRFGHALLRAGGRDRAARGTRGPAPERGGDQPLHQALRPRGGRGHSVCRGHRRVAPAPRPGTGPDEARQLDTGPDRRGSASRDRAAPRRAARRAQHAAPGPSRGDHRTPSGYPDDRRSASSCPGANGSSIRTASSATSPASWVRPKYRSSVDSDRSASPSPRRSPACR